MVDRNVTAHGYASAEPEKIHRAATRGPADLEAFTREVSAWLEHRPENHTG